jgi:hypothetical protein
MCTGVTIGREEDQRFSDALQLLNAISENVGASV